MDIIFWAMILSIFIPYSLYAFVYKFPYLFLKVFPPKAFAIIGEFFKPVEFGCIGYFLIKSGVSFSTLPFGLTFIFWGQVLNYVFYKILGADRVYYGTELGVTEFKLYTGFPFSIGHSQYKGCILTLLGLFMCFNQNRESFIGISLWILLYMFDIIIENGKPGPYKRDDKKD